MHGQQLDSAMKFEIINITGGKNKRIGFRTKERGISKKLKLNIRPGNSIALSKELKQEIMAKKLRIGVPVRKGFKEFVNKEWNFSTNRNGSGFCNEVFDMVVKMLPYHTQYEYIFFENSKGEINGSYDDLIYRVYLTVC